MTPPPWVIWLPSLVAIAYADAMTLAMGGVEYMPLVGLGTVILVAVMACWDCMLSQGWSGGRWLAKRGYPMTMPGDGNYTEAELDELEAAELRDSYALHYLAAVAAITWTAAGVLWLTR